MKQINYSYLSDIEKEIIDRVLILDVMACSGWEVHEILRIKDQRVKGEFARLINDRIAYLDIFMKNKNTLNIGYLSS